MSISEIKKEAREALNGKWGKVICILLAYMLFTFALGLVEGLFENSTLLFLLISIAVLVISMPLSFGLIISFIKFKRGEDVKAFGFLKDGFSNFSKAWGIFWHTFIRMLLPIACLFFILILMAVLSFTFIDIPLFSVAFIILYIATLIYTMSRALLYAISYNVGYDNPELSSKECVLKSEKLMKGNRGTFFILELSFIGWAILSVFTLGIGLLWLAPYMSISQVCFYDKVAKVSIDKIEEA